ncbi:MAG: BrnT family toxin [Planctomycetes bacterium]|nr:BrnT family toxin [Planctomycetota bacterium]
MEYEWGEGKNEANIKNHGLDFLDAVKVLEYGEVLGSFQDTRMDYGEERFLLISGLYGEVYVIVYTYIEENMRLISFRRATKREARRYG